MKVEETKDMSQVTETLFISIVSSAPHDEIEIRTVDVAIVC